MVRRPFSNSHGIKHSIKSCVSEYLYRVVLFTRFSQKFEWMGQCYITREIRPFSWPKNVKTQTCGLKAADSTLSSTVFRCDHFAEKNSQIRQLEAEIKAIQIPILSCLRNWQRKYLRNSHTFNDIFEIYSMAQVSQIWYGWKTPNVYFNILSIHLPIRQYTAVWKPWHMPDF